jgi:fructokinase
MAQSTQPQLVIGIGELLWDLLPSGPRLGGTVSNFAVMAGRLGSRAVCASRVGADDLGRRARADLSGLPLDTAHLQTDSLHPTGTVGVRLKDGQPQYTFEEPVAWDSLELSEDWLALAAGAAAVCFGTLAQRNPVSRRTIEGFLAATPVNCVRVFDINLRAPFYSTEVIERSLKLTTLLKMNDSEMPLMLDLLGLGNGNDIAEQALLAGARRLLDRFPVNLVCVTMGGSGSLLVTREQVDRHAGIPIRVVDTVGAGDAFTAALTHYYLRKAPLSVINDAGNRWGSWVASQAGAMPRLDPITQDSITAAIGWTGAGGRTE